VEAAGCGALVVLVGLTHLIDVVNMAKPKNELTIWNALLSVGLYKRNQGRWTRQLTAVGVGLVIFFGCWVLSQGPLDDPDIHEGVRLGVPLFLAAAGAWVIYRMVNYPRFADFLISVEAEMDKVSWASRQELFRATAVVLVTMFLLGMVLFAFDRFWMWFFSDVVRFLKISA
jgi:preprotein translocase subunit SecE